MNKTDLFDFQLSIWPHGKLLCDIVRIEAILISAQIKSADLGGGLLTNLRVQRWGEKPLKQRKWIFNHFVSIQVWEMFNWL